MAHKLHATETSVDFVAMQNAASKEYLEDIVDIPPDNQLTTSATFTSLGSYELPQAKLSRKMKAQYSYTKDLLNKNTQTHPFEKKVIELTNIERRKNGLPDLKSDAALSNVARIKSEDMQSENYFSHISPNYGSSFEMMSEHGVSYHSAGENIARGTFTPEQVVDIWLNSNGNSQNILSSDFTHIAVAYEESGHIWTQIFIEK